MIGMRTVQVCTKGHLCTKTLLQDSMKKKVKIIKNKKEEEISYRPRVRGYNNGKNKIN